MAHPPHQANTGGSYMVCAECDHTIVHDFVDYDGTIGWVHADTGEALCDPDNENSPAAFPDLGHG